MMSKNTNSRITISDRIVLILWMIFCVCIAVISCDLIRGVKNTHAKIHEAPADGVYGSCGVDIVSGADRRPVLYKVDDGQCE